MRAGRASGVAALADRLVGPAGDGPDAHSSSLSSSSSSRAAICYASLSPGSSNSSSSAFFLMTTRLCSIVFEAAQQAQHAAPVSQECWSYPTIGFVNEVCAGSTDLARPVDAETPDRPQPTQNAILPETCGSRGLSGHIGPARAPRGAITAGSEKMKKSFWSRQLDRTALSVGPRGLRYHRGEY